MLDTGSHREQALLDYVESVLAVNRQLVEALKECLFLLAQFTEDVPDQHGWILMLAKFDEIISIGERLMLEKRTLH